MAALFSCVVLLLLVGHGGSAPIAASALPAFEAPPLHAVQLFKKPEVATGQLVPVEEGLDVLRAQTEPFTIIAAVGPTRTGKSSILGRAFLRGANENVFETGGGVTSPPVSGARAQRGRTGIPERYDLT